MPVSNSKTKARSSLSPEERESRIEMWIGEYGDRIYRTALYYLKERELAEDIGQETFLQAFGHMDEFRGKGSPASWLMRIAVNLSKDMLHSALQRDIFKLKGWDAQMANMIGKSGETVTLPYEDAEDRLDLAEALDRLDTRYRDPLVLHYYYGFREPEIAVLLNLTPAAVRKKVQQGRDRLQKITKQE